MLQEAAYYIAHPQIRSRGSYEFLTNDVNNINEAWPARPNNKWAPW